MMNVDTKFKLQIPGLWLYRAKVVNIVDGDTIDCLVDKGTNDYKIMRIRLQGINTPEIHNVKKTSTEYKAGMVSKKALEDKVLGKEIMLTTHKGKTGKYGRYLGTIELPSGPSAISYLNINNWMVTKGYAVEKEY